MGSMFKISMVQNLLSIIIQVTHQAVFMEVLKMEIFQEINTILNQEDYRMMAELQALSIDRNQEKET
jgi:hypothetical protein